jgi:uncharacterized surface protein with fasciclin (FAS1) repeats
MSAYTTATMQAVTNTVTNIFQIIALGVRRDTRVRWGLGAGISVLLFAMVLGVAGSLAPDLLRASDTAQAQQPTPVTKTPIVFPVEERQEGLAAADMSTSTVLEVIQSLRKAERYELMLYNSGLTEVLKGPGNITVFVPVSAKFDYLPRGYIASLTRAETRELALGHIVERALPLQESLNGMVPTASGTTIEFSVDASAGEATIGGANILKVYKAKNGMVYLIDKVLVPSE